MSDAAAAALESFVSRADSAEKELSSLFAELETLQKTVPALSQPVPAELDQLRSENAKLKYRLNILQKAAAKEDSSSEKRKAKAGPRKMMIPEEKNHEGKMRSVLGNLTRVFRNAITQAFPDIPEAPCPVVLSAKQGDYQFNGAMAIAGILKVF